MQIQDDRPTIDFAILAALRRRGAMSGYAVTQRLRQAADFWSAPHSQVYPRLGVLESDGLVRMTASKGRGPRPNKVCRITAKGRRALRAWASAPPGPRFPRDELVLKLWGGLDAEPDALVGMLEAERANHISRLEQYEAWMSELLGDFLEPAASASEPAFGSWAALARGIGVERAWLDWCDEVRTALGRSH
ncbi:MAG: PadR family transcriptional regulator [Actinomycetes bacterium]